jgi:hypothetical protein
VRDREVQIRCARRVNEQLTVQGHGPLVVSEADDGGCVQRLVLPVPGLDLQQRIQLRKRRCVLVPLDQHSGIVVAGEPIIGREHQHCLEQDLPIVENVALDSDSGQEAHCLDVVAMLQQKGAHDVFRGN